MTFQLKYAPLVEIVAELRWGPPPSADGPTVTPQFLPSNDAELMFQKFAGIVYQHGFRAPERLIPPGAPPFPGQMCWRYRQESRSLPVLTQIGPDQFSVNALPPYKSWEEFRPWVRNAVSALLEARGGGQDFWVSLRYIDAFKTAHRDGMHPLEFLESLGMSVNLPPAILARKQANAPVSTNFNAVIPVNGMKMTVRAGEGIVDHESAAILDTLVTVNSEVEAKVDSIIQAMDDARDLIHSTFKELIGPIIDRFGPEEVK